MPPERDSKVDPRAGDVLEIEPGCCLFRHVAGVHLGHVTFNSRCGQQWLNSSSRITLNEWRADMKDGKVIHAAA